MTERRLVTAALPYINNVPHLGHIVGSHLPADIFARYSRMRGFDVVFVGGTDEHGSTSEIAASELNINIDTYCARLHAEHEKIYKWLNISYDMFSRTSSPAHHASTQEFFKKIQKNGYISEGKVAVPFSPSDNRFLPDRYVLGTCPFCSYKNASGDQCEKCTKILDASDLINPQSKISGARVEIRESKHLFLRLDLLANDLKEWIDERNVWRSQVTNLARGWLTEGLKERCITRDLRHGVPVPHKDYDDKVFYVWFDAPIGYVSFTKEARPNDWQEFWKGKDSKTYHFLGKDNIPFHTLFWPGMLMAHGEFNLPYQVVGLQYLNYEGKKFSKSQKIGIFCEKLPETGLHPDTLRAYLTFLIPETADSDFQWSEFQNRINADMAGNYGNFVNRTVSFIRNKLGGIVNKPKKSLDARTSEVLETLAIKHARVTELLENVQIRPAFQEILSLSSAGNRYFEHSEPWKLVKTDVEKANEVLYVCGGISRALATLLAPYIPKKAQEVWNQLGLNGAVDNPGSWNSSSKLDDLISISVGEPSPIFQKITDAETSRLREILSQPVDLGSFFENNGE